MALKKIELKKENNKYTLYISWIALIIFIAGLICIFIDMIIEKDIKWFINPFFSKIPDHSIWIGIWILMISVGICAVIIFKEWGKKTIPKVRYFWKLTFIILNIVFYLYTLNTSNESKIFFYTVSKHPNYNCLWYGWSSYISEIWLCIIIMEIILFIRYYHNKHKDNKIGNSAVYPYLMDSPTKKDDFNRSDYAKVLLDKIFGTIEANNKKDSEKDEGSFVINISESYGYGKSSFLLLLKDQANVYTNKNQMVLFEYKPWLCDSPQKIISEFFKLLNENLSKFFPHIGKTINKYVRQLSDYYSSKNPIVYVISNCFKEQSSILKEKKQLRKDVESLKIPIVVLIDEVDRLHDDELMTLLSLLRNTADFTNVFYILAADIDYVKQVLKQKGITDSESYIKKFINFEFLIPGFDVDIMNKKGYEILHAILEHAKEHFVMNDNNFVSNNEYIITKGFLFQKENWNSWFTNIRDMKRFFNNYSMAIDSYIDINKDKNGHLAEDFNLTDLFYIELLKYLYEPIYKTLRDNEDKLMTLRPNDSSDPLRNQGRYKLEEKIEETIKGIFDASSSFKWRKRQNPTNQDSKQENTQKPKVKSTCGTISDFLSKENPEELAARILSNLFNGDVYHLDENSICYQDAYFRYFSYRFKNDMISNGEVKRLMFDLSVEEYKDEVKLIKGKKPSFEHRLSLIVYTENEKSQKIDFIKKLFIFFDEFYRPNNRGSGDPYIYYIYNVIIVWFSKITQNNFDIDELRNDMRKLILTDSHYDLLSTLLEKMDEYKENLIFDNSDILYWCSLLINRSLNDEQNTLPDNMKKDIKDILNISMFSSENVFKWLTSIVKLENEYFAWNDNYINDIFKDNNKNSKDRAIDLTSIIKISKENLQREGITNGEEMRNDLMSLLKMEDISKEKAEEHPFLGYVERVNKEYLHE